MSELLPCPFCGSEAELLQCTTDGSNPGIPLFDVRCPKCLCRKDYSWTEEKAEAIADWNARTPDVNGELVAALEWAVGRLTYLGAIGPQMNSARAALSKAKGEA